MNLSKLNHWLIVIFCFSIFVTITCFAVYMSLCDKYCAAYPVGKIITKKIVRVNDKNIYVIEVENSQINWACGYVVSKNLWHNLKLYDSFDGVSFTTTTIND